MTLISSERIGETTVRDQDKHEVITSNISTLVRDAASSATGPRPDTDLDIVIPVLNEESRILPTLHEVDAVLRFAPFRSRVVVVDNGSVDRTVQCVESSRFDVPVDVISCGRRGKGAAVRAGILHTRARYVAYCDADRSTPPENLLAAFELLEEGWDIVAGSRRTAGAEYTVQQPLVRRVGSRVFHMAAARVAVGVADTQCGFKAMKGTLAREVFGRIRTDGFAFDVEFLARSRTMGGRICELPVSWSDDDRSKFKNISDGVMAFRDLYHVRNVRRETVSFDSFLGTGAFDVSR